MWCCNSWHRGDVRIWLQDTRDREGYGLRDYAEMDTWGEMVSMLKGLTGEDGEQMVCFARLPTLGPAWTMQCQGQCLTFSLLYAFCASEEFLLLKCHCICLSFLKTMLICHCFCHTQKASCVCVPFQVAQDLHESLSWSRQCEIFFKNQILLSLVNVGRLNGSMFWSWSCEKCRLHAWLYSGQKWNKGNSWMNGASAWVSPQKMCSLSWRNSASALAWSCSIS